MPFIQKLKPLAFLLAVLLFTSTSLTGCYSAKLVAPPQNDVQLADQQEELPVKTEKRNWYILWGLIPLNDTSTDDVIEDYQFTKVRAETKVTPLDFVINIFTGIVSIYTTTTEIEGTRGDAVAPAPASANE